MSRVCVRATNWLGDAVMSLPATRPSATLSSTPTSPSFARTWVAGLYARETSIDRVIPYTAQKASVPGDNRG
jgi:heptosyltransferase-2